MSNTSKTARCRNCGARFDKSVSNPTRKFCADKCRNEFWRNGGVSFLKIQGIIESAFKDPVVARHVSAHVREHALQIILDQGTLDQIVKLILPAVYIRVRRKLSRDGVK